MDAEKSLAEAFIRNYRLGGDEDFQAFARLHDLIFDDPEAGWRVTQLALKLATTEAALAYVAAGPLENLLRSYGPKLIDRVYLLARHDERFRQALGGVWLSPEDAVWDRWCALLKELGISGYCQEKL